MARSRPLLVAFAVFSAFLAGCAGGSPDAAQSGEPAAVATEKTAAIEGRVVTDEWLPLKGADVTLLPPDKTSTTNDAGAFAFNDVGPGAYSLIALKIGYFQKTARLTVEAGKVYEVDLILEEVPVAPPPVTVEQLDHGNLTVGTVNGPEYHVGMGIDGEDHPLVLPEQGPDGLLWASTFTKVELVPSEDSVGAVDLDLYLLDAEGEVVDSSTSSEAHEVIEHSDYLPAGEYTIRVIFWAGAAAEYALITHVTYEQGDAAAYVIKKEGG